MASLLRSVTNRSARFALRVRERASKETTPAAGETVGAARRAFRGALGRCAFALLVGAGIAAPACRA